MELVSTLQFSTSLSSLKVFREMAAKVEFLQYRKTAGAVNKLSSLDALCSSWLGRKQHTDISGGATQQTAVLYGLR